jgi:bla regulator protein blaR1
MRTDRREMLAVGLLGSGSRIGERIEALLLRGRAFSAKASRTRVAVGAVALCGLMGAGSLAPRWIAFAQQQPQPAFEIASVKPDSPSDKPGSMQVQPGRLNLGEVTVKMLVQQAYAISGYRIYGGPSWLDSARYSVAAKAAANAGSVTLDQMRPMLQTMLKDRFQLAVHREEKELPLYRLVVSRNGPKLRESTVSGGPQSRMSMGRITDEKATIDTLASQLGQQLGRFVSNQTGLKGDFAFHVEWAPDPGQNQGGDPDTPPPAGVDGPSIFTALQDQLGLKLESGKGPVEVLVIDHVEKPDAN